MQDDAVTDKLAQYAIQGVEFSYLRVASISTYSQRESGQYKVGVLYGFADDAVLQAIGLTKADAYKRGNGVFFFTSDKLSKAMSDALTANATTVKNALETAVRNGGKAMPETDANGHSRVSGLEQGLYLVVETRVPENVISTCNPFFVSLPMTTIRQWDFTMRTQRHELLWKHLCGSGIIPPGQDGLYVPQGPLQRRRHLLAQRPQDCGGLEAVPPHRAAGIK